jgi:hypothetical protein
MTLSFWEQFIIQAAVSFLSVLKTKLTNPAEVAGIDAAIAFLQDLLGGKIGAK